MDNENRKDLTGSPENLPDLEQLLASPDTQEEITADELAIAAHGMSDMSDMELEKIMQEAIDEDWGDLDLLLQQDALDPPESDDVLSATFIDEDLFPDAEVDTQEAADAEEEPEQEEIPEEVGVPRKVRPKRKHGYGLFGLPHLASTAIWLILAVAIGTALGRLGWICATDLLAFGREDKSVTITITAYDDLDSITAKLHNAGLIEYPELFKMYCKLAKVEEKGKISAGTFELNTLYDYHALVGGMSATSSYRQTVTVTIPEGYTCAQIFALLEKKGVCSAADLEEYAATSEFAGYWFLEGVPRGDKYCLEGFLFPNKYEFYTDDTPRRVFIKLLDAFAAVYDEEKQQQLIDLNAHYSEMLRKQGYPQSYINEHQLTLRDMLTIASLIEKESAHTGEHRQISSVIYNRLSDPDFPYLNIDATLVYALGGKTNLTDEDKKVDSPYNTYLYKGLPPGPICNPGEYAIIGALTPDTTDKYYYALDPSADTREHKFFTKWEYDKFLEFIGRS